MASTAQRASIACGKSDSLSFSFYNLCMRLKINGDEKDVANVSTLVDLVESLAMKSDRVAVELNREIVPRSNWAATTLKDGDQLEIVHFVGGG